MAGNATKDLLNIQIIEQLYITTTLLKKRGDRDIFKAFGLTTSLFAILTKISAGKNSSSELQAYIEGTPASIAQKLRQLEEKGIITRRLDENDKRRWIFEITEKGQRILAEIQPVYETQLERLFDGYNQSTKSEILGILEELGTRLK
jgi:MarR family 2-MHQ and catechol resistance regulon transcriptional repressor